MESAAHVHAALAEVRARPAAAKLMGLATLSLAAVAAGAQIARSRAKARSAPRSLPDAARPGRMLHASAALLGLSVLADSAMEHWRGSFENPGMLTPLLSSTMTIAAGASAYATAVAVGVAGTGFHVYNVLRRPGGLSWMNLFYAAPLGAPAALSLSGLLGLAAQRLARKAEGAPGAARPRLVGLPAGRALAALTALGIAGTSSEAGLLHFRGAFQNPFMWLPVTVPPLAALALARAAIVARQRRYRLARALLDATAVLGVGGVGFHAWGVSRQMGGWRNARQNILSGPPLPAPPAFSALALAGNAALSLLQTAGARRPR